MRKERNHDNYDEGTFIFTESEMAESPKAPVISGYCAAGLRSASVLDGVAAV